MFGFFVPLLKGQPIPVCSETDESVIRIPLFLTDSAAEIWVEEQVGDGRKIQSIGEQDGITISSIEIGDPDMDYVIMTRSPEGRWFSQEPSLRKR